MIWYECTAEGPASLKCLILLSLSFLKAFLAASLAYFCRFQDTPGNKANSPGKSWRILQNMAKNTPFQSFPDSLKVDFSAILSTLTIAERNNNFNNMTQQLCSILQYIHVPFLGSVAWSSRWSYFLEYAFTFFLAADLMMSLCRCGNSAIRCRMCSLVLCNV